MDQSGLTVVVAGGRTHVFCAVLAWSRYRFVRFAADAQQATTLGLVAERFEELGGVPKLVLADRMACLKGNVVANVVVPAPDYVRFASHYRFRPDFCPAADPESKGIVENVVGYAKGAALALSYLGLVALLLVPAAAEAAAPGPADGSFFFGFGMLATMPLSSAVMLAYSGIATAQGIPLSDQDGSWWVIPAYAVCALVNAWLILGHLREPTRPATDRSADASSH